TGPRRSANWTRPPRIVAPTTTGRPTRGSMSPFAAAMPAERTTRSPGTGTGNPDSLIRSRPAIPSSATSMPGIRSSVEGGPSGRPLDGRLDESVGLAGGDEDLAVVDKAERRQVH